MVVAKCNKQGSNRGGGSKTKTGQQISYAKQVNKPNNAEILPATKTNKVGT